MSTGMADLKEVEDNLNVLIRSGTKKENITLLHCHSEYPTQMKDVNLRAMLTLKEKFGVAVGYSDHTEGIEVPLAAVALGATVIEKHFTLDKKMKGPDHKASLNPDELKAMIKAIRNIEQALGDGIKKPSAREIQNRKVARKSIHIACDLPAGTILSEEHLIMKRPEAGGISPMEMYNVIGKRLLKNIKADEQLKWSDVE
jgi:sialic acid synthase SpsE